MPTERPVQAACHRLRVPAAISWSARLAWLAGIAALVAIPASTSAATPPGTTGGSGEIPARSLLDQVLPIVVPIASIAVMVAVLSGLAFLVARLGGRAVSADAALLSGPTQARWSAPGTWAFAIVAVGASVVGILVGREIAYEQSLYAFFGGVIPTFFLGVTVVGLGVTGLLAVRFRHGHVSGAIVTILATAGLLAAGAVGGDVTASVSGGTYVPSVVLHASGTATAAMPTTVGPFVPRAGGTATCDSVPDGRSVGAVTALDLGKVGPGTLRGTLSLPAGTANGAAAELWIDGGDLPDGSYQPFWSGPVAVSVTGADETTGTAIFVGLQREGDSSTKSGSNARLQAADGWPATLSGTMTWTCEPW